VVAKHAFLESLLFAGERDASTIVYCSHQMDEIERVADNLIILEEGCLVTMSPPEDFCERVSYWVADLPVAPGRQEPIPGVLQQRAVDGQQHLVVLDQEEGFSRLLETLGATAVQRVPIGLDRAVNAYLSRSHSAPANP
jgi:ABC-2 type transport system ATP-binding protein